MVSPDPLLNMTTGLS